ncbi:tyrosine-type recombinase/integrase [Pseudorhodoplanes sp.]|uniref:tyrosine-type recombinase/integrase n=1 Tax=Pseudorhodoplanes sp. TaxID=1934341 RepID=UPI002C2FF3D5|nr:tyrosine-type recombinase/integrase [Pseudorhodoplanes sp.]HWV44068.1 tyrosine-type recombinase/integrase [Pseudorhodoplanes sp.]
MKPMKIDLPYLYNEPDHRGNPRLYVRKAGRRVRIKERPGTPEFMLAYSAALETVGTRQDVRRQSAAPGSFGWLAAQYFSSSAFDQLDLQSQRTRRRVIEECLEEPRVPGSSDKLRDCPMRLLGPDHVQMLLDRRKGFPGAANNRLKYLSAMFGWAIPKHLKANPARDIKPVRYSSDGFYTWTLEDVRQFEERHPIGTKARLALALLLYTGARRGDVVTFGRQHVKNGWLRMVPKKTRHLRATAIELPILPVLEEAIREAPTGDLTFLVTEYGKPFTAAGFGAWFRKRCDEAGLEQCTAHGLRKAGAARAAEAGATDRELMALFGWTSSSQATTYTRAADQKRLAAEAVRKLEQTGNELGLTTLSHSKKIG